MTTVVTLALLSAFKFQAPDGWTDMTRCPDEGVLSLLPETVQQDAVHYCQPTDGGTATVKTAAFFAVDLRHLEERKEVATMMVALLPGETAFDAGVPRAMAESLEAAAAKKGDSMEIVDAVTVDVGGEPGAKLRFLRPYRSDRLDMYVIPHDGKTAMMSFIASVSRYEDYEPVFAVTAHRSIVPDPFTPGLKVLAFVSVCFGALIGYYLLVTRRRRKRT